jgi:hypothetical protein
MFTSAPLKSLVYWLGLGFSFPHRDRFDIFLDTRLSNASLQTHRIVSWRSTAEKLTVAIIVLPPYPKQIIVSLSGHGLRTGDGTLVFHHVNNVGFVDQTQANTGQKTILTRDFSRIREALPVAFRTEAFALSPLGPVRV